LPFRGPHRPAAEVNRRLHFHDAPTASQRQLVISAVVAVVIVWLIVIANYSHGAIHVVGLVLGVPVIGLLFLVALRFRRANK
jgi:hypothetical protein